MQEIVRQIAEAARLTVVMNRCWAPSISGSRKRSACDLTTWLGLRS